MSIENIDLSALSRAEAETGPGGAGSVPLPRARWKTRILAPGALLGGFGGLLLYAARDSLTPTIDVRVAAVIERAAGEATAPGAAVVQAPGWVEADPFAHSVTALASGVVEEVLALEGQAVKAGQVVARLVTEDAQISLRQAEAEVALRQAELATAQAALNAAQRDWDNPIELTRKLEVARATLAERRAELERWPAELASEEALAEQLRFEHERVAKLHEQGQTSDLEAVRAAQQHLAQRAKADATRGRRPMLAAQIEALKAETIAAERNLTLRIPETKALDEARAAVDQAQAAVRAALAARDEANLRLNRMQVVAPVAGLVQARLVAPGSKVMLDADDPASAVVLRLYDPAKLQVRVDVPLSEAAKVGVGQAAEVVVHVLPDRAFRGCVTRVTNEADVQKNTLQVKVAIENPAPELKPEMLARVKFLAEATASGPAGGERLFAPRAAIQVHTGGHAQAWIVDAERRAQPRTVSLGASQLGDWFEVSDGLRPGDRVILDDPARLSAGRRVNVVDDSARVGEGGQHAAH